jgi:hypothetical protein
MGGVLKFAGVVFLTVALLWAVCALTTVGHTHAQANHIEADAIWNAVSELVDGSRGKCISEKFKLYWSPLRGTLLILLDYAGPETNHYTLECGAIFNVTSVRDGVVEPILVEPRERTAYCKQHKDWQKILVRDMYIRIDCASPWYNTFLDYIK